MRSARTWPRFLLTPGHENCLPRSLGKKHHPLPFLRLLEAVGVALGHDKMGVVHEPVHAGGGDRWGHELGEGAGVDVEAKPESTEQSLPTRENGGMRAQETRLKTG